MLDCNLSIGVVCCLQFSFCRFGRSGSVSEIVKGPRRDQVWRREFSDGGLTLLTGTYTLLSGYYYIIVASSDREL